jgi:alpha-tubulin suppressor-like RCC1 family protein
MSRGLALVLFCAVVAASCDDGFVEPPPPAVIIDDGMGGASCEGVVCGLGGSCREIAGAPLCACAAGAIPEGTRCVQAPATPVLVVNTLGSGETSQAGGQARVAVQLSAPPTSSVTIPIRVSRADQASVGLAEVVIVPEAWNEPQVVVVTGLDDGVEDGPQPFFLVLGPSVSQDPLHNGLEASASLTNEDALCGDGVVGGAEQCDEPGASQRCAYGEDGCTVCSPGCALVAGQPAGQCGDGVVQPEDGEQCDEQGASQRCDYSVASCVVCDAGCKQIAGAPGGMCGDSVVQSEGGERCDPPSASQQCRYGEQSCVVCDAGCQEVAGAPGERCGDELVQAAQGEECDGTAGLTGTCVAQGFAFGGAARCASCKQSYGHCFNVAQVSTGHDHSCAVMTNGTVYCWGDNGYGQLGDGTFTQRTRPVQVMGLTDAEQVSAGGESTCAVVRGGAVHCWGANVYGQLGRGSTGDPKPFAAPVVGLGAAYKVSVGERYACAITNDDKLWCWGRNELGQLGDGSTTDRRRPLQVAGLTSVTEVSAGDEHACALDLLAGLSCWGRNTSGQLGDEMFASRSAPAPVRFVNGAEVIAAGQSHSCATVATGAVRCWGLNRERQLGDGTTMDTRAPVEVAGVAGAEAVGVGSVHSCALVAGGGVQCWGANSDGQLGDGTRAARSGAVSVAGITGATQLSVSTHSCVVVGGRLRCWGSNFYGQLGDGTSLNSRATSVEVPF